MVIKNKKSKTEDRTPSIALNKSIRINKTTLLSNFFEEYYQRTDYNFIKESREMLEKDPTVKFCVEVCNLYLLECLREYEHSNPKITTSINETISTSVGSWKSKIRKFLSCFWYGFSFTEISFSDIDNNQKSINEIVTYDPLKYDFVIKKGQTKYVSYMNGVTEILVPYECGVHLVTGDDLNFDDLYGNGRCKAALPYWELHKIIMPVIALAAQRQATPILVKKTDTGADVILIDDLTGLVVIDSETGEPVTIKKGWDAIRQLEKIGSAGITVIDPEDELYAIELKVNNSLLMDILKYCEQQRMSAMLVPSTIFNITNSGIGDSGLSKIHLEVFENMVNSMADFLNEELIEKLFKPLIIYNFGTQENYGKFIIEKSDRSVLEVATLAIDAISRIPTLEDLEMLNSIRKMLGIPPLANTTTPKNAN